MKTGTIVKIVSASGAGLACLMLLSWTIEGHAFSLYKFWAPKWEDAKYETFKNSRPYRDGVVKELYRLQIAYTTADDAHKNAIGGMILGMLGEGDESKLPGDLQQFINQLRQQQLKPAKADK